MGAGLCGLVPVYLTFEGERVMSYLDTVLKDYCERSYNWLNGEQASAIAAIAKKNGCKTKRVAQQRGALGVVKVIMRVDKFPGWASNNQLLAAVHKEIMESVKLDSLWNQN